jgi:hypothetical protein
MDKVKFFVYGTVLCFALALAACGSSPDTSSLQSGGGGASSSRSQPAWVTSVNSVYSKAEYVAAVGTGNDRQTAEKNAFAALVAIFGQSIAVDEKISSLYQDAVRSGVITNWTENNTVQSTISTSASMDTLVGAEIKATYDDPRGTVHAVAVMEKARTAQVYSDMIKANLGMINNLVNMTAAEKNSLGGYSRYQFAAAVADINISYKNVLDVIGAPSPAGVKNGFDYRQELNNIASAIPIAVTVAGDRQGRIQGAISKALSELGFRSGGNNSRYTVDARLSISEAVLPNQTNKFARYEITANLVDTSLRQTLIPYTANGREGHATLPEAENRAVATLERKISEEYKELINNYLSQMLPKK